MSELTVSGIIGELKAIKQKCDGMLHHANVSLALNPSDVDMVQIMFMSKGTSELLTQMIECYTNGHLMVDISQEKLDEKIVEVMRDITMDFKPEELN